MQLPSEVVLYLENCEEQGFVPDFEMVGNKFDAKYGEQQVTEWIEAINIPDCKQSVEEHGSVVETCYKLERKLERVVI